MKETIVKNLLIGLGIEQSALTWSEEDYIRQFMNDKISQNQLQVLLSSITKQIGADDWTRTSTLFLAQAPEACASTNFATSAIQ